jgi:hypothetical protein
LQKGNQIIDLHWIIYIDNDKQNIKQAVAAVAAVTAAKPINVLTLSFTIWIK